MKINLKSVKSALHIVKSALLRLRWLAGLIFVVGLTMYMSHAFKLDQGSPKGYDGLGQVAQVEFVAKNFPHILWNPYWYNGFVFFPRGYPPLYHTGLGLLVKFAHLPATVLVRTTSLISLVVIVTSFYIVGVWLSRRLLVGLTVSLLLTATPAFWAYILEYGLQLRLFSLALYSAFLVILIFRLTRTQGIEVALKEATSTQKLLTNLRRLLYRLKLRAFAISGPFLNGLSLLLLTACLLSHLLVAALSILTILILYLLYQGKIGLKKTVKFLVIGSGLTSFYFLPYFTSNMGLQTSLGEFTANPNYAPLDLATLVKQGYPGLNVVLIPLTILLYVIIWLVRDPSNRGKSQKAHLLFYYFATLGLGLGIYSVGGLKLYLAGLYPTHAVFMVLLFLTLAFTFAATFLGTEVISAKLLLLIALGLSVVSLTQIRVLSARLVDNTFSRDSVGLIGIDETKEFRFASDEEMLASTFNLAHDGLQTDGYNIEGALYPEFYYWYRDAVFYQSENTAEAKFLLDWFAVNQVYLGTRDPKKFGKRPFAKFDGDEAFIKSGASYIYKNATPVFWATDIEPIFVDAQAGGYEQLMKDIAQQGYGIDRFIPLKFTGRKRGDVLVVSSLKEIDEVISNSDSREAVERTQLHPHYVNSERWEVDLEKAYTGLVFKQSYHQNWRATLIDSLGKRQRLSIYMAGPGMMYVDLIQKSKVKSQNLESNFKNGKGTYRVIFEYKAGFSEWMGALISMSTLLCLLIWLLSSRFKINIPSLKLREVRQLAKG